MDVNPYKSPSADGDSFAPQTVPSLALPVTFEYHLRPEDMLCWCRFFYYTSLTGRRQRWQAILLSAFLYLITAFVLSVLSHSGRAALVFFAVAILASFLTPRWFDRRISRVFKKHLDNAIYAGSFGPHQLTLSDAGVRDTGPAGETFVKWPFVIGASREGDHIFIQLANGHAVILERESLVGPVPFEEVTPVVGHLADQAKLGKANPNG